MKSSQSRTGIAKNTEQRFTELQQKYASALQNIEQYGIRLQSMRVQDDKLHLNGSAPSEEAKNRVWDAIKAVDPSYNDILVDILVDPGSQQSGAVSASGGVAHTVDAGETLTGIAQKYYGDASAYMEIFHANSDKLIDPNNIQPGQELLIPPHAK